MVPRRTILFSGALVAASLYSCGGDSTPNPIQAAFAQQIPTGPAGITVAFRFPRQADTPIQLYTLPTLEPVAIEFEVPDVATAEFVGFVREEDLIYTRTVDDQLRALDLTAGRFRLVDSLVQRALIGPTGAPFTIRSDLTVNVVRNRQVQTWPAALPSEPLATWGALRSGVLAYFGGPEGAAIALVTQEWDGSTVPVPTGLNASSPWGDLFVVATDSGLVAIDTQDPTIQRFYRLRSPASALAVSPSGHRVYAASGPTLYIINRFDFSLLETVTLPAAVNQLRTDPLGKYLLIRPAEGELLWIAPVASLGEFVVTNSEWTDHLPMVGPDGSILLRHDGQLRIVNGTSGATLGSATDAAGDTWVVLTWDPRRPTLQVAAQRSTRSASPEPGVQYYAQVSSTSNLNWAQDEVTRLNEAGLPAQLIPQSEFDDRYRVGLGPFRTREEAEETGRILGRAFFVVTIDSRENQ